MSEKQQFEDWYAKEGHRLVNDKQKAWLAWDAAAQGVKLWESGVALKFKAWAAIHGIESLRGLFVSNRK